MTLAGATPSHVLYVLGLGALAVLIWASRIRTWRAAWRERSASNSGDDRYLTAVVLTVIVGTCVGAILLGVDVYTAGLVVIPLAVVAIGAAEALIQRRKGRG